MSARLAFALGAGAVLAAMLWRFYAPRPDPEAPDPGPTQLASNGIGAAAQVAGLDDAAAVDPDTDPDAEYAGGDDASSSATDAGSGYDDGSEFA